MFLNEYMLNPTSVLAKIQEAWGLSDNNPARARILAQKNSSGDTAAQLNVHVHRQALTEENRAALELWYGNFRRGPPSKVACCPELSVRHRRPVSGHAGLVSPGTGPAKKNPKKPT